MPINILMPALSPTMEKGNLAKWLVKEGDKVASGDVIAEIETDKATMEVEAVDEGTVAKIVVAEGTSDVPVNDIIAVLAAEGEDAKAASDGKPQGGGNGGVAQGGGETGAAPPASGGKPSAQAAGGWGEKAPETAAKSEGGEGDASGAAPVPQPIRFRLNPTEGGSVYLHPRWRAGLPGRTTSTSPRLLVPGRTAGSCNATSKRR
jgi:pyruvate dehydrogenase E2 component (dihydrolipoamide acetyltransferase)